MKAQMDKTREQQSATTPRVQQEPGTGGTANIVDNRPGTVYQRKLRETMNASAAAKAVPIQQRENKTGLPDTLKTGIESLSGYAMDDVKVHYNSNKPTQLQAHAYAQGTDIHIAPGQEKHLPHEAWHVVQQKQGRVKPTMQLKSKVHINDDAGLEKEADVMGAKALQLSADMPADLVQLKTGRPASANPIQRYKTKKKGLTVAGEFHSKSEEHRSAEKRFAKHIKSDNPDSTDDFLWKENTTPGTQAKDVEAETDDSSSEGEIINTASEKPEHLALSNIDRIKHYYPILVTALSKATAAPQEGKLKPEHSADTATIIVCANAVMTAIGKMYQNLTDAGIALEYGSEEDNLITNWNRNEKLSLDYIVQEIREHGYFSTEDKDGILENKNFLNDLETINKVASKKIDVPGRERAISHNFIRSRAMHELANKQKDVQGIWLIGQYHVQEIREHLRHDVKYDLVSMFEFNSDIREFVRSEEKTLNNALSSDGDTAYLENETSVVPGLNDRTGEISVAARLIKSSLKYFIDLKRKKPEERFPDRREGEIKSDIQFHVHRLVKGASILMNIQENDLQNIDFTGKFPGTSENINKKIEKKITHIKNRIGLLVFISHLHRRLKGSKEEALKSPPAMLSYLSYEDVYHAASELEKLTSIAK